MKRPRRVTVPPWSPAFAALALVACSSSQPRVAGTTGRRSVHPDEGIRTDLPVFTRAWVRAAGRGSPRALRLEPDGRMYVAGLRASDPAQGAEAFVDELSPAGEPTRSTALALETVEGFAIAPGGAFAVVGSARPDSLHDRALFYRSERDGAVQALRFRASATGTLRVAMGRDGAMCLIVSGIDAVDLGAGPSASRVGASSFVAGISAAGRVRWSTWLTDTNPTGLLDVAVDASGRCLVAGTFRGPLACGGERLSPPRDGAPLLALLDDRGALERCWSFRDASPGGGGHGMATGLALDAAGHRYVSGSLCRDVPDAGSASGLRAICDPYVARVDAAGGLAWQASYPRGGLRTPSRCAVSADGATVVTFTPGVGFVDFGGAQPRRVLPPGVVRSQDVFQTYAVGAQGELVVATRALDAAPTPFPESEPAAEYFVATFVP